MRKTLRSTIRFFVVVVIAACCFSTTNAQPVNADFELGNFTGWTTYAGCYDGSQTYTWNVIGTPVAGRHDITSGAGTDPLANFIPVVSPWGGQHSIKLGNRNVGTGAERVTYSYTVDTNSALLVVQFAVLLHYTSSHSNAVQPRLTIRILNASGNLINNTCGFYDVPASTNFPDYVSLGNLAGQGGNATISCNSASSNTDQVKAKPWDLLAMDVSAYIGQTITIEITVNDCSDTGHFGYGYFDLYTSPLRITGGYCPGDSVAVLSAPLGFDHYLWSSNAGNATTQSVTLNNPLALAGDTFFVTCTPTQGGAVCATTLMYVFEQAPIVNVDFNYNAACGINDVSFVDASFLGAGTIDSWTWWVDGTYAGNSSVLDYTFPSPGSYDISLTTNSIAGCPDTLTRTIYVGQGLSIAAATPVAGISCAGGNDGYATVSITLGSPPYSISWNNGAYNTDSIYGLSAGQYTLEVSDSAGCHLYDTLTISEPTPLLIAPTTEGICYGFVDGKIRLNTTGGSPPYNFTWSHNASLNADSAAGLLAGTYSFTITDSRNCSFDSSITLLQPSAPYVVNATHTDVTCFSATQGSASVTSVTGNTPAYTYAWNTTPIQTTSAISNLAAGTYICTITDANGCTTTVQQIVIQPAPIIINLPKTDVRCFGESSGSVTAVVSGGTRAYTYNWSTGDTIPSIANISIGNYSITVMDNNLCTASATTTIVQPVQLSVAITSSDERCFGSATAQATATPAGGTLPYSFVWSTSPIQQTPTATNLAVGTYTVSLTDAHACTASVSTTINQPSVLSVSVPTVVHNVCFNGQTGSATAVASGGSPSYSFAWGTTPVQNTATASQLRAGTYSVTVTDDSMCSAASLVVINQPLSMEVSHLATPTTCFDSAFGSIKVFVSRGAGSYSYAWSPNVSTVDSAVNILSGNYSVTVTDADGCSIVSSNMVVGTPPRLVLTPQVTTPRCNGFDDGAMTVAASGGTPGYVYSLWQNGVMLAANYNGLFSDIPAGIYQAQFVDDNNCVISRTVTVSEPSILAITLVADSVNCYKYDDGRILISANGGTAPYTYDVAGFPRNTTGSFLNVPAGEYSIHVEDKNGCIVDSSTIIYQPEPLEVVPDPDSLVAYLGETKPIILNSNYASTVQYLWQPTEGLDCATCDQVNVYAVSSGYYIVNAVIHPHDLDCEVDVRIPLTVIPDYSVYVPNAFSPNNNGANDFYEVFGKKESWGDMKFQIFNRWGELVFESSDPNFKWDGTYKGAAQPSMVYVYTMTLTFIDGHKMPLKRGSIVLIR